MPEGLLRYLMFGDTVVLHGGLALMVGALASLAWARRGASTWARDVLRASRRIFVAGAVLALVAAAAGLWLQSAAMGDDGALASAGPMVLTMLRETHYGRAWSIGFVALALALAAGAADWKGRCAVAALGVATFAYARSAVSHAAGDGDFTLRVAIDWVHLLLACLWVGMVLVGAFPALRLPARTASDASDAAAWVAALSSTATGALPVILFTGALKAWWATPSVASLRASDFGAVLLVKLSLVAMAVALGGFNRWRVLPALRDELRAAGSPSTAFRRRFVQVLRVEALVLLLVLVAAAVLSGTEPPAGA